MICLRQVSDSTSRAAGHTQQHGDNATWPAHSVSGLRRSRRQPVHGSSRRRDGDCQRFTVQYEATLCRYNWHSAGPGLAISDAKI